MGRVGPVGVHKHKRTQTFAANPIVTTAMAVNLQVPIKWLGHRIDRHCRHIRRMSHKRRVLRFGCFRHGATDHHLVEQLPDQAERIHLIVMLVQHLPSGEASAVWHPT